MINNKDGFKAADYNFYLKRNSSPKQALQSKFASNKTPKKSPHPVKKLPAISTPEIPVPWK